MSYVQIVFNRPLTSSYTYAVSSDDPQSLVGRRAEATLGTRKLEGVIISAGDRRPDDIPEKVKIKEVTRIVDDEPVCNADLIGLSAWMARTYMCSQGEVLNSMIPGGRRDKGIPALPAEEDYITGDVPVLSDEQEDAVRRIGQRRDGTYYLYGITGSGKTEVFLRAASQCLEEGRGILYLVPEISLTHQVVEVIRRRFGDEAAILHSGLSPSQRIAEWRKILRGECRFVIGARSAVFAPLDNIGLIIIDEEHESSYKSGSTPRYHGRQVAMHRAATHGARLVMGSATPSVEAWHHMKQGTMERLTLSRRLSGGELPSLEIVSLEKSVSSLSPRLHEAMKSSLSAGNQVILFLNRRGFGYFYHCRSCGQDFTCRRCSVSLTYHKTRNRLVCHHCGYEEQAPSSCPSCGSLDVGFSGFGTQKVEEDVANAFPSARVLRLDTDSVKDKKILEKGIRDFRTGKIDILLGTQMVAKGLNFPGVNLVGIIMADSSLHLPDFRSHEKTFSLITQVAGRAGRYRKDGLVILQTLNPRHPVIVQAAGHRIDEFYQTELHTREQLGFPPFQRIIRLVVRGKDENRVEAAMEAMTSVIERFIDERMEGGAEILGPSETPIYQLNGNFRRHLLLLSHRTGALQSALPKLIAAMKFPSSIYVETDLDPQNLL